MRHLVLGVSFSLLAAICTGCTARLAPPRDLAPPDAGEQGQEETEKLALAMGVKLAPLAANSKHHRFFYKLHETHIESYLKRAKTLDAEIEACRKAPQASPKRFAAWMSAYDQMQKLDDPMFMIEGVQSLFNVSLTYDEEKAADDVWSQGPDWIMSVMDLAKRGKGTCADIAIAKVEMLGRLLGKENAWLVMGVSYNPKDGTFVPHAVAVARLGAHYYVLDNMGVNISKMMATGKQDNLAERLTRMAFVEDAASFFDPRGPQEGEGLMTSSGIFTPFLIAGAEGMRETLNVDFMLDLTKSMQLLFYKQTKPDAKPREMLEEHLGRWSKVFNDGGESAKDTKIIRSIVQKGLALHQVQDQDSLFDPVGSSGYVRKHKDDLKHHVASLKRPPSSGQRVGHDVMTPGRR